MPTIQRSPLNERAVPARHIHLDRVCDGSRPFTSIGSPAMKQSDKKQLQTVASNLEGFWAEHAALIESSLVMTAGKSLTQALREDAATLYEIASRMDDKT